MHVTGGISTWPRFVIIPLSSFFSAFVMAHLLESDGNTNEF